MNQKNTTQGTRSATSVQNESAATERATAQPGAHEPAGASVAQSLPEITQQLRSLGVTYVRTIYDGEDGLGTAFLGGHRGSKETIPNVALPDAVAKPLVQWFYTLLQERWPHCFRGPGSSGQFEWDVVNDTLEHTHESRRIVVETSVRHGL